MWVRLVRSRCMPRQSCGGAKLAAPISFAALAACFGSKNALARDDEAAECRNCRSKPNARQTCGAEGAARCGKVWVRTKRTLTPLEKMKNFTSPPRQTPPRVLM